jgi:hypothetical protein
LQEELKGERDAFITKLDSTGLTLLYSTYLGGSNPDEGHGVTVDLVGNVYVTGLTTSTNFPKPQADVSSANPFQVDYVGGPNDAFVAKISDANAGATFLGGGTFGGGTSVGGDNTYLGGMSSGNFPTANPAQQPAGNPNGLDAARSSQRQANQPPAADADATNSYEPPYQQPPTSGTYAARSSQHPSNRPPVVAANNSSLSVNEGTTAVNSVSSSDPDSGDTVTLTASVGTIVKSGSRSWSWSFPSTDGSAQTQTVTVTATDSQGATANTTFSLIVDNVPPTIGSLTGPKSPLAYGKPAKVTADFTDAGTEDTHTCSLSWQERHSSTTGKVSETAGKGSCAGTHTYMEPGVYPVSVRVTDKDSGTANSQYEFVVVYDPPAGFVTGSGWINSPAGAYLAKPSLTGKAKFGFVSKFKKGTTASAYKAELRFHIADFNFHSTSCEPLAVSRAKAQLKGSGTVNSAGDYGFLLTVSDEQASGGKRPDRFRLKIWDKSRVGAVLYDNVIGASDDVEKSNPQAVGGGSIIIQAN